MKSIHPEPAAAAAIGDTAMIGAAAVIGTATMIGTASSDALPPTLI
jgi:hypothetical protein